MTEQDKNLNTFETSGTSPPAQPPVEQKQQELSAEERKQRRTTGLKLFDIFLYPFLTNFVVFGMSVGATYLTSKGHEQGGAFGRFMHKRGAWLEEKFRGMGMPQKSAEMSKIVFFSFADGTLIAPLVKVFEDRREKIGKWIDDKLGTTPSDLSVYQAEPKQTWGTVLGGRVATVVPVVLTALALDRTGLNDKLFRNPGIKLGEWIQSKPNIAKKFGKIDIPEVAKVSLFEAFYTSVCTTGLYFASRAFARRHDEKTGRVEVDPVSREKIVHTPGHQHTHAPQRDDTELAGPSAQVSAVQAQSRLSAPAQAQTV